MKRKLKTGLLALFITVCMVMGTVAYADTNQTLSITVICKSTDKKVTLGNMKWQLYQVAQKNKANAYSITDAFQGAQVSLEDQSTSALAEDAKLLAEYADAQKLAADAQATGTEAGVVTFTQFSNGKSLTNGVYLLVGEDITRGGIQYTSTPVMVELADWSTTNAQLTVYAKFTEISVVVPTTTPEETTTPEATTNQETTTKEETTTNPDETGTGTDGETPSGGNTEQPTTEPEGEGTTYVDGEEETTTSIDGEETTTDVDKDATVRTGDEEPSVEATTASDTGETSETETILPQTGQLQWPIPVMALSGIVFVGTGITFLKKDTKDEAQN